MSQGSRSTVLWEHVSPSVSETWPTNVVWEAETHLLLLSVQALLEQEHEKIALSEVSCQIQGELFPAREQEEQLRQQVEEQQENGQNIKAEPQAVLHEAQSDIKTVKRKKKKDMKKMQDHWNLHQKRGNLQNQVSERVSATPVMELSHSLQNFSEKQQAERQEAHARLKAREKRLKEEIKIIEEKISPLLQALQKQVEVLTSHLAACKNFQQMTGSKKPRDRHKAQELSQLKMLQVGHVPKMVQEKRTQWKEVEH
ncbi:hypothetical protein Nmel_008400 [Mimus melanotis]